MSVPTYTSNIDLNTFKPVFLSSYEGAIGGLWSNSVTFTNPVNSLVGVYPGLAAASGMTAWTGSRQLQKPLPFKLSLTSAAYENSVKYPLDNFNTDSIALFTENVKDLAAKAAWHNQSLVSTAIKNGHTTAAYDSLFDGSTTVYFFSAVHPYGFDANGDNPSGTQKNLVTSSTISSLDVATIAAPTVAEAANIIQDCTAHMLTLRDLAGDAINANMKSILILVGDAPKFTAFQSAVALQNIQSTNEYGGAVITNPITGWKSSGFNYEVVLDPNLTGPSVYFLRKDSNVKPVMLQQTEGITFQTLGPTSEYAAINNQVVFGAKHVVAAGPLLYQSALKATLS